MTTFQLQSNLSSLLREGTEPIAQESYLEFPITQLTDGIKANAYYFNNPEWAEEYLIYCHRSESFRDRWLAAVGDWTDKVVVDVGCGPGNLFATLQGKPKLLLGIDVAPKSLESAAQLGYTAVLADANDLPFTSGFADVVMLNATLHHCDDMKAVLTEAARLVKTGGLLVTDHDPQFSAWNYKGLAKLLWNARLVFYRWIGHSFHKEGAATGRFSLRDSPPTRAWCYKNLFMETLKPLGFEVRVYPHNHELGADVLKGAKGKAEFKYRIGNLLSGRNPDSDESALSLMCVARKVN